ncbi:hypothetical protein NL676_016175 [Syzygium grande]|nr:hypothetical protein NL676_016175 [Syzygium grande]
MEQERPSMLGDGLSIKERPVGVALGDDSVRWSGIVVASVIEESSSSRGSSDRRGLAQLISGGSSTWRGVDLSLLKVWLQGRWWHAVVVKGGTTVR